MSNGWDKPYRIEVRVDAPRDVVWRALTDREQIRHWFGWEAETLDEEIEYIFLGRERDDAAYRLELDSTIELLEDGDRTIIRATKPGDLSAVEWEDVYGDIEEGWITFFNQLRHRFEHRATGERQMLVLRGELASLPELPGTPYFATRYQRAADVDGSLVIVGVKPSGEAMLLVTAYGDLDEARWTAWWERLS